MKTPISNVRSAAIKLAMVSLIIFNSFGVLQAQSLSKSPAADIKYLGMVDDKLVFEVEFKNDEESTFQLEIKDEKGYQFYSAKFKQKTFRKRYAIDKAELGNSSITFVLATKGNVQQQEFDVNATSRLVEEVSVVKL
ncbi:MAG TPA: hypothetical protein VER36_00620 [Flavisolibacter sp.]|nr:hypothetical protein [Flavisolibacter sp.]